MDKAGSIVCVGLGMMLGAHLSPRARSHIEQADILFAAVSDALVELWLKQLRPDVRSLQPLYAEGKSRHQTYREMVDAMLREVRAGARVCGAFYGHPGVFAQAPHAVIAQARAEGFEALMEPGISAADCLFADLGIDPGNVGVQHFEASQLLLYQRRIDPSACLIIWQAGVVGDRSYSRFATSPGHLALLQEFLTENYPPSHHITVYEAATLPITRPRIEKITLDRLASTPLHTHSTLVLPASEPLLPNHRMLRRLQQLEDELEGRALSPQLRGSD